MVGPMQSQTTLTDPQALGRNRARASAMAEPALFLQLDVVDEVQERLDLVNRSFTSPTIVTGWPQIWSNLLPNAHITADQKTLDLTPGAHDLVIHAMSLHWADDPVGQLIQCKRALKPDGLFLCALFGGQTLSELRAVLAEAEVAITGGLSPRVAPMAEIRDLGALLQRAGFALPVADTYTRIVTYSDAWHLMHDLRAMGENNALATRIRHFSRPSILKKAVDLYQSGFGLADGRIPARFEMIYLTGWAPDDSQPKPLRPGSATARLADALGVDETSLTGPGNKSGD